MSKLNLIVLAVCAMMSFALRAEGESNATANSDLTSENTFGLLRVDSTAKETIVAVPWVEAGSDDQPISVDKIISSKNLVANDELLIYHSDTDKLEGFVFDGTSWVKANNVSQNGELDAQTDPDKVNLPRGAALFLRRNTPSMLSTPFYLFGQVAKSAPQATTIVPGAWNLIAPPTDHLVNFNDSNEVVLDATPHAQDTIYIGDGNSRRTYSYQKGKWSTGGRRSDTNCSVGAGIGAWYVSSSNSSVKSITWKNCPTAK